MKTDGYIITPELLQWKYFHRPVVVQVLIHVLLSSAHNEASVAVLSYRDLAMQLHTSPKAVRIAIDTLVKEKIFTKCSSPRSCTMIYVNSSHPLSHCVIPWQNPLGAQNTAQMGALLGAQIGNSQISDNQGCRVYYQDDRGTDRGKKRAHPRAQQKSGAQEKAQIGAQINNSQTSINKEVTSERPHARGTDKDIGKGTLARKGKKETKETKENISPTPPLKEKKEKKEKSQKSTLPLSPKKEKEKKSVSDEEKLSGVLRLFNQLFIGSQVKTISKITPERRQMVMRFVEDHGFDAIEPMFRKALASDLLMGRTDGRCSISFNWLFTQEKYTALMEGTYDNPSLKASASAKTSRMEQGGMANTTKPSSEDDTPSIGDRWREAQKQGKPKDDGTEALRKRYLEYIDAAAGNPRGSMAKMVREAYDNGTLAELGIVWNPSVEEESQSLLDLDDNTKSYLEGILND